ncbi:DC-STAMP domain-containing protein 2-like isoform X2 [Mercenaria mercenaria]|nr:DC-STAMP domain-containing protein 2-like isoform X2 [Mercenaria mercenaria]
MEMPPETAFPLCALGGLVLTLTMAFSMSVRCLVLLMLPQFFSGKGRMLLLFYAMFLAMNHPLNNIKVNIGVMAQSATCGQEMALNGTKALIKSAVAPMQSVMDSIKDVMSKLVDFANTTKKTYNTLKQTVMEIGSTIKRVGQWLANMVDRCNDKMGAPYRKCKNAFGKAVDDCRSKLGIAKFACSIADGFSVLCNIVRVGELLCHIVDLIKCLVEKAIDLPSQRVLSSAQEMFYFNVSIKYHFNYTLTQSKKYSEIKEDISKEIMSYLDNFILVIRLVRNVMVITIAFILIKALIYRSQWLSNDRYDNIYITFTVRDLDERRKEKNKPGILPLNFDEEKKYVESVSGSMIRKEKKKLAFGLVLFFISFFNAAFYLFCDYGLYSALHLIETNFGVLSKPPVPAHTKMHVAGAGPMADMYRSVVGMFDPLSGASKSKTDVAPCVPRPSEPDWGIYKLIGVIYFVCLILTISEAYGLRLRHLIMACYFPRRERKRAIWLFNHILKTRGGILENARNNMKKNKKGGADAQHISLKGRLAASFPIVEKILKCLGWEVKSCLYCGKEGKPDDYVNFVHCAFFDCDAVYCIACYADLDNVCAVCDNAVEMKGGDDSEEEDSSVDERQELKKKVQKMARKRKIEEAHRERINRRANMREKFLDMGSDVDLEDIGSNLNLNSSGALDIRSRLRKRRYKMHPREGICRQNRNNHAVSYPILGRSLKHREPSNRDGNEGCSTGCNVRNWNFSENQANDKNQNLQFKTRHSRSSKKWEGLFYTNDLSDGEISSGSSIDTEDLEFDYQYLELDNETEFTEYENSCRRRRRHKIDLVSSDIFSDTSSESDNGSNDSSSSETFMLEPMSVSIRRE